MMNQNKIWIFDGKVLLKGYIFNDFAGEKKVQMLKYHFNEIFKLFLR